jgi:predicted RND superfamily exporter protein
VLPLAKRPATLVAMGDPDGLGFWVAHDRTRLRMSAEAQAGSSASRGEVLARLRAFLEAKLPESWAFTLTGPFAMEFRWAADLQRSQLRSFAVALLLVFALVSAYLRSWRLGLAALVPAVLPVVATLGFMGYAGLLLDVGRSLVAAIVIGIAVDDAVHLLGQYQQRRQCGAAPAAALEDALEYTGPAVLVTSVALSLGFLALSQSAWASIASFGALVSAAILGALLATLCVLPPLLLALEGGLRSPAGGKDLEAAAQGFTQNRKSASADTRSLDAES